jgi:hypothetical protein
MMAPPFLGAMAVLVKGHRTYWSGSLVVAAAAIIASFLLRGGTFHAAPTVELPRLIEPDALKKTYGGCIMLAACGKAGSCLVCLSLPERR